ncbi:NAD(P)/FAD-dependent oxidoreductase [Thalassotalea piscium]|uniref:Ferredoxin--NADP reductase n=1 Tax=Thalassotalea piscium TaxID=1230533 RepID=A0A7X0NE59_9GAMM|nr:NAD(P)/FAD-dependent oxidoreductase [Thalassotalea piscium]MBB6541718.1 thioredoxin reductase (NADPH) [Thalassotalea piscium]
MNKRATDVVIIGAGPVGLFQVFELGLQGLKAIVIDSVPEIGGQCSQLYPEKPIYDIPAIPMASAQSIVNDLAKQASPFKPEYLLSQKVIDIEKVRDDLFYVKTDKSVVVECRAVIIAAGSGAFEPVRLKVKGVEVFENKQLFYSVKDKNRFANKNVVILGGGDSAFDWALTLQPIAKSVLLIHRSSNFRAAKASVVKMEQLCDNYEMQFLSGQVVDYQQEDGLLSKIIVQSSGIKRTVELDHLLVFFGLSPKIGPIANWHLAMNHHQVCVDTEKFQTSVPGIYAVGDINYYPGKRKLILSGFHEAALAAFAIKQSMDTSKRVATLYTTTSPILHKLINPEEMLVD